MVTRIFWPSSVGAWRVRSRMRGRRRETGVAKTVCWESEVSFDEVSEVRSMWHTYLWNLKLERVKQANETHTTANCA